MSPIANLAIGKHIHLVGIGGAGGNADATTNAGHGGWAGWARGAGVLCSAVRKLYD
jgi:hypothetical protein